MPPAPSDGNRNAPLSLELGNYIAAGLGMTVGTNFFINRLPEPGLDGVPVETDTVHLVELPAPLGHEEDQYLDTELFIFDLWSSSPDSMTAYSLLRRAYDILERKSNFQLVNWYVYFSYANGTIKPESRGREGDSRYSQGWTLKCRNLNNIS